MLLRKVYNEFIEDKRIDVTDSTIETIENRFNNINRYFYKKEIEDITKKEVRKFQKYLLEDCDFSVNHINHLVGLLKQIFRFARETNLIETNCISSIAMINKQVKVAKEKNIWTLQQFNQFDLNIKEFKDRVVFNMLFFLGIRKGELLSLKWSEINFSNHTVRIISTASRKKGVGQIVTPPKTKHANRLLIMNDSLNELIFNYYILLKKQYKNIDDMYVVGNIKMMSFTSLQRLLNKYLEMSELPQVTLHGFRHSHATMLAELTNDIKSVSEHLGHESIEVTVDTYYHSSRKSQERLAKLIENKILSENKGQFELLKNAIEQILIRAIGSDEYTNNELDKIIHLYDFLRKEVIIN